MSIPAASAATEAIILKLIGQGDDHEDCKRDTLDIRDKWADSLQSAEKYTVAASCNAQSLMRRQECVPKRLSPKFAEWLEEVLENRRRLAENYSKAGWSTDSIKQYRQVLADKASLSNTSDLETYCSDRCILAEELDKTGKAEDMKEAVNIYQETLAKTETVLGSEHVQIVRFRYGLGVELARLEKFEDAKSILRKNVQVPSAQPAANLTQDGIAEILADTKVSLRTCEMAIAKKLELEKQIKAQAEKERSPLVSREKERLGAEQDKPGRLAVCAGPVPEKFPQVDRQAVCEASAERYQQEKKTVLKSEAHRPRFDTFESPPTENRGDRDKPKQERPEQHLPEEKREEKEILDARKGEVTKPSLEARSHQAADDPALDVAQESGAGRVCDESSEKMPIKDGAQTAPPEVCQNQEGSIEQQAYVHLPDTNKPTLIEAAPLKPDFNIHNPFSGLLNLFPSVGFQEMSRHRATSNPNPSDRQPECYSGPSKLDKCTTSVSLQSSKSNASRTQVNHADAKKAIVPTGSPEKQPIDAPTANMLQESSRTVQPRI
ncbi:uncharacterized protein BDZ99DRAFT_565701 [Mytilinidion resinicola]|uniref:TPR-like protein n=1 Tax=Mytilinidion resinicola TaxID=574789 RepID=A0A6A6Z403_9PEZI|nr:uncharacterized protein BDZ99DRAFT_565701 [Mytilinidion resinicola]KAF2815770.1 hypothetical protein BDZ99DRAFT_565701 [Mytilinidion resinicola]